jgi:hypothetical protein
MKETRWKKVFEFQSDLEHCLTAATRELLDGSLVIANAAIDLRQDEKVAFLDEIGLSEHAMSKWLAIAKRERLRELVSDLPPSFSILYAIAMLTDPDLDALVASGLLYQHLSLADLTAWISDHRARASEGDDNPRDQDSPIEK